MPHQPTKKTANQPPRNGGRCLPVATGLMGTTEKRIAEIKAQLAALEENKDEWDKTDFVFLKATYQILLNKYQSRIEEAHSGLVDELTPNSTK